MALQSLELFEAKPWRCEVERLGLHLQKGLRELQSQGRQWGRWRGLGLMLGLEVIDDAGNPDAARAGRIVEAMLARGVILLSGGGAQNVLSFTPPFMIEGAEIDFALRALHESAGS
jgi:4-aminobutyrate aminotransferase